MAALEAIFERNKLNCACKQVKANKGEPGVDGMTVDALRDCLRAHAVEMAGTVKAGKYKPQLVRRVMIPKEEKVKFRPLGIPTAVDRVIQQTITRRLSEEYEPVFSTHSRGFRPNRSCQTAISEALEIANQGCVRVVDLDLSKFFDAVNHSKLLQLLSDKFKDGRIVLLIHKILRAPMQEGAKITPCEIGTPQGGPVSPVLANVMLNGLERRGRRFVRHADDMMIFCKSRKAAERTLTHPKPYAEGKLFLKLNELKTKICRVTDPGLKFLGFGFWRIRGRMQTAAEGYRLTQSRPESRCIQEGAQSLHLRLGQLLRGGIDEAIRQMVWKGLRRLREIILRRFAGNSELY